MIEFSIGRETYYLSFPLYTTKNMYVIPPEFAQPAQNMETKNIIINLPSEGTFVVFLVSIDDGKIAYMEKSIEGTSEVVFDNVDISNGKSYNILVVALFRQSGWVPNEGTKLIDISGSGVRAIINASANSSYDVVSDMLVSELNWFANDGILYNQDRDNGYFTSNSIFDGDGDVNGYIYPGYWLGKWDWAAHLGPQFADRPHLGWTNFENGLYVNRPYKFDALFQNQRFIRAKLEGAFMDQWFANADSIIYMSNKINKLVDSLNSYSLISATISTPVKLPVTNININVMDVLLAGHNQPLTPISNNIINNGENIYTLGIIGSLLNEIDTYSVMIRPRLYKTTVRRTLFAINTYNKWIELGTSNEFVVNLARNDGFVGYQFEVQTSSGINMNGIVVSSTVVDGVPRLHVAHSIEGLTSLEDVDITLISQSFDPVFFNINMKRYDVDLLARSSYAKHSKNTVNGECLIYDENGNIYKKFSTYVMTNENGHEIQVREPHI